MVKKVGQRKFLLKCGYTDEQLNHMTPHEAHNIISEIEKANRAKRESQLTEMVVISRVEYEALLGELHSLTYKYDKLLDDYRLCKDANETIKQKYLELAKEFGVEVK